MLVRNITHGALGVVENKQNGDRGNSLLAPLHLLLVTEDAVKLSPRRVCCHENGGLEGHSRGLRSAKAWGWGWACVLRVLWRPVPALRLRFFRSNRQCVIVVRYEEVMID
jgi:hypothetical protein